MLYRTENQFFTTFSNFKHVIYRSFIGPPIFFTGPPTFSSVEARGLTSFPDSVFRWYYKVSMIKWVLWQNAVPCSGCDVTLKVPNIGNAWDQRDFWRVTAPSCGFVCHGILWWIFFPDASTMPVTEQALRVTDDIQEWEITFLSNTCCNWLMLVSLILPNFIW